MQTSRTLLILCTKTRRVAGTFERKEAILATTTLITIGECMGLAGTKQSNSVQYKWRRLCSDQGDLYLKQQVLHLLDQFWMWCSFKLVFA